jgi:hemerythrin-like domain-containing protein
VKRSEALRSLSRDHHQALAVAQRISRADDAAEAAALFLNYWCDHGQRHFRVEEEEVLLPTWALLGAVDYPTSARMVREHLDIRAKALRVAEDPSLERLHELGRRLASHVRFEERQLFPLIEADLEEEEIERLADAMAEAEKQA